jgi:hypothetical protein
MAEAAGVEGAQIDFLEVHGLDVSSEVFFPFE